MYCILPLQIIKSSSPYHAKTFGKAQQRERTILEMRKIKRRRTTTANVFVPWTLITRSYPIETHSSVTHKRNRKLFVAFVSN